MGQGTPEKTDRNEDLKNDYLAGMATVDLVSKYGITEARIHQILLAKGIVRNRRPRRMFKKKGVKTND